jgi:large subunit ribosomal protein L25
MTLTATKSLVAERRADKGKGAARQLRLHGRIPAVIYGRGRASESLSISSQEFERMMIGTPETRLIDLAVEGKPVKALIREIQRHPFQPGILHVDFYEVHEGETITLSVAIHIVGVPEGVRVTGGVLDQVLREVEIEVLPGNIPERVQIDVSSLGVGQSLHVSDLVIENAEILTELQQTICTVVPPRVEEEAAAVAETEEPGEAEPELIRKPKEEGEGTQE